MRTRVLHRKIGLTVSIFLFLFVITGLLVQHTALLDLDKHYAPHSIATKFYGVTIDQMTHFKTKSYEVSHAGSYLYLDGVAVEQVAINGLQGVVENGSVLWVLADNKLWLLSTQAELLDELSIHNGLPDLPIKIAKHRNGIVIKGLRNTWLMMDAASDWQLYTGPKPSWVSAVDSNVPPLLQQKVLQHARDRIITWERLLIDLHSGRLFGVVGVIIADIISLLLLVLAVSGLILWSTKPPLFR